jgi:NADH-ubiquinone oxidoreductase chain 4
MSIQRIRSLGLFASVLIAVTYITQSLTSNQLNHFSNIELNPISVTFVILTVLIIPVCIMASYNNIVHGYFSYIGLLLTLEAILVYLFATSDLIGFYVAFELALLPLYILVGCYGASSNRLRASLLLWSYTMVGSLCLLVGVIYLIVTSGTSNLNLLPILIDLNDTRIIWILFAIGLAIKVPSVPFHIWLPRAHVEANVSSSILLAAIILKLSTYGSLLLLLNVLTSATAYYQDLWLWLALVSFLHSSIVTMVQIDSKTLIAYSSVAHMAIITVGLHSNSYIGILGAIILAIAHASSSSSLFIIFGQVLYDRLHTRTIYYLRNIGTYMPSLRALLLLTIVANSGTPGTINWLAEFYVLIGSTYQNLVVASVITSTVLLTAAYSYWMFTYLSNHSSNYVLSDATKIEQTTLLYLLIPNLIIGIYPSVIEGYLIESCCTLLY